ncbi:MAG TPA: phage holin family protein [Chlamydiales bacterium]|nr:phage holin family protein [Chlamydiales bacterium]
MYYLKTLFFNFLVVFFANHILPGIEVSDQTKLPHIGGDLIFAVVLGGLNTLIYPVLKLVRHDANLLKIGLVALILNFAAYAIVKLLPIGIHVMCVEGYVFASAVVAIASFIMNFLEMKHSQGSKTDMPQ